MKPLTWPLQASSTTRTRDHTTVKDIFGSDQGVSLIGQKNVVVGGWVRTGRTADKGAFTFLEINDGSCPHSIQVLVQAEVKNPDEIKSTGVCIVVEGEVKASPDGAKQKIELHATAVLHVGPCEALKPEERVLCIRVHSRLEQEEERVHSGLSECEIIRLRTKPGNSSGGYLVKCS